MSTMRPMPGSRCGRRRQRQWLRHYALTATGVWTYTLDNSNAAVQALNGAATLTDSFTALTADGTAQLVTITIVRRTMPP